MWVNGYATDIKCARKFCIREECGVFVVDDYLNGLSIGKMDLANKLGIVPAIAPAATIKIAAEIAAAYIDEKVKEAKESKNVRLLKIPNAS